MTDKKPLWKDILDATIKAVGLPFVPGGLISSDKPVVDPKVQQILDRDPMDAFFDASERPSREDFEQNFEPGDVVESQTVDGKRSLVNINVKGFSQAGVSAQQLAVAMNAIPKGFGTRQMTSNILSIDDENVEMNILEQEFNLAELDPNWMNGAKGKRVIVIMDRDQFPDEWLDAVRAHPLLSEYIVVREAEQLVNLEPQIDHYVVMTMKRPPPSNLMTKFTLKMAQAGLIKGREVARFANIRVYSNEDEGTVTDEHKILEYTDEGQGYIERLSHAYNMKSLGTFYKVYYVTEQKVTEAFVEDEFDFDHELRLDDGDSETE